MIDYEISIDVSGFKKYKHIFDKAQKRLIESVKSDTSQYVPADTLSLTNSAYITNNNTELVYKGPYAHFQYAGYVRVDANNRVWVGRGETKPYIRTRGKSRLEYSKSPHPKATSEWIISSEKDNKEKWINEVRETIKNG